MVTNLPPPDEEARSGKEDQGEHEDEGEKYEDDNEEESSAENMIWKRKGRKSKPLTQVKTVTKAKPNKV